MNLTGSIGMAQETEPKTEPKKNHSALESAYFNQGRMYALKKDYLSALENFFEALTYSKKHTKNRIGYIYMNISETFGILNRFELAKKYMELALDDSVAKKDKNLQILVFNAYSRLFYREEKYPNALYYINLSLSSEAQYKKYVCAISSYYQKAMILLEMEEKSAGGNGQAKSNKSNSNTPNTMAALNLLKTAIDVALNLKKHDDLLPVMSEYTEMLIELNRIDEADAYLKKIDDIFAPYYPYYFFYYYLKAFSHETRGEWSSALFYYRKTAAALDRYFDRSSNLPYDSFKEKTDGIYSRMIEFYLKMFNKYSDPMYLKKAVYFSEIKNVYIYETAELKNKPSSHFSEQKRMIEQNLLELNRQYIALLKQTKSKSRIQPLKDKLDALNAQKEEIKEFIQESPISYRKYYFNDFHLSSLQDKLSGKNGEQTLILRYTILNDNVYVFCIDSRSISYKKLKEPASRIIDQIKRLNQPLNDFTQSEVDYLRIHYDVPLAHQLYKVLLKDIVDTHPSVDELLIIPDSQLFNVPFEALVTGFNKSDIEADVIFSEYGAANYVIQNYRVSYALSLFHLQRSSVSEAESKREKRYTVAAFGAPVIQYPGYFEELPSSEKELSAIPQILGEDKCLLFLKDRFTRSNFEKYAPRAKIIHVATHFINNLRYPLYTALLFSPAGIKNSNSPANLNQLNSIFFYAYEVFKLALNAELVVLSACESSENDLMGLQGLRGMTAAFMHAGVGSMIVSRWPVDEHSSSLIRLFYRMYKKNGEQNISRALVDAQLSLMKQTGKLKSGFKISYAHPFIWDNYILYRFSY